MDLLLRNQGISDFGVRKTLQPYKGIPDRYEIIYQAVFYNNCQSFKFSKIMK